MAAYFLLQALALSAMFVSLLSAFEPTSAAAPVQSSPPLPSVDDNAASSYPPPIAGNELPEVSSPVDEVDSSQLQPPAPAQPEETQQLSSNPYWQDQPTSYWQTASISPPPPPPPDQQFSSSSSPPLATDQLAPPSPPATSTLLQPPPQIQNPSAFSTPIFPAPPPPLAALTGGPPILQAATPPPNTPAASDPPPTLAALAGSPPKLQTATPPPNTPAALDPPPTPAALVGGQPNLQAATLPPYGPADPAHPPPSFPPLTFPPPTLQSPGHPPPTPPTSDPPSDPDSPASDPVADSPNSATSAPACSEGSSTGGNDTNTGGSPAGDSLFGQTYDGTATYYGSQPQKGQGACSINRANDWYLPWTSGVNIPVAITYTQWQGSAPCGQCLAFRGTGSGSGRNPVPETWQYAMIVDECPDADCQYGHLDLQTNGDGAWGVEWVPMQCNVGNSYFQYSFEGSSSYYVKMQIDNTRVPIASVTWNDKQQMQKTGDDYWLLTGSGYSLPAQVTITSVLGDIVTDTVPNINFQGGVSWGGHAQFPLRSGFYVVGDDPSQPVPANGGSGPSTPSSCTSPPNSPPLAAQPPPSGSSSPPPSISNYQNNQALFGRRLLQAENRQEA